MKLYEGMLILDDARCAEDYNATVATVHDILKRQGAEIVDSRKWDERKLAYPIRRHQRGVYVLIHFNAPAEAITAIDRQLRLAPDAVLRHLITTDEDGVSLGSEKEAEKAAREARRADLAAQKAEKQAEKQPEEPRKEEKEKKKEEPEEAAPIGQESASAEPPEEQTRQEQHSAQEPEIEEEPERTQQ